MRGEFAVRRLVGVLAILALLAATASDFVIAGFWVRHPMLTSVVSALLVILLSAAVIDVIVRRRAERRWRLLAQFALIELAEAAHMTWSGITENLGFEPAGTVTPDEVRTILTSSDQSRAIRRQVGSRLAERVRRDDLRRHLTAHLEIGRQLMARWAVAMTGSDAYVGIFDRHVELYGRVEGLAYYLGHGYRRSDPRRQRGRPHREFRAPGGEQADEWFVDNVITTLNIAVTLEDQTWALALEVVPPAWWDRRTVELAAVASTARTRE